MFKKILICIIISLLILSCRSSADFIKTGDPAIDIKNCIDNYIVNEKIPGMGLLYYSESTDTIMVTAGVSDISSQKQINADTVYDIGSTTKVFISLIIIQLEAEGKISLDSKLGTYINIASKFKDIKIRELLNHTSSIPDYIKYPSDEIFKALEPEADISLSFELLLDSSMNKEITSERGKWEYSNTNYLLLGKVIEEITGNTIGKELSKRVFIPNNMTNTYYMPELTMKDIPNIATGYQFGNSMSDDKFYYLYNSAGGIVSTLKDMFKFAEYLLSNPEIYKKLERNKVNCKIETTMKTEYGLGIILSEDVLGRNMSGHGGTSFGFKSEWWFSHETGEVLILYANSSMHKKNFFTLREQLSKIVNTQSEG